MTFSDYRDTYSWTAAIELGRPLTILTEELPAQEDRGLIMAIQSLMIELPAAIASDLVTGSTSRLNVVFRLQAALELIERVYPALDTAVPKVGLDALLKRTESASFAEVKTAPVLVEAEAYVPVDQAEPQAEPISAPVSVVVPESV